MASDRNPDFDTTAFREALTRGLPTVPEQLPPPPAPVSSEDGVSHAPHRPLTLSTDEQRLALANAMRYFAPEVHAELAPEFARELVNEGRIYMRRLRPTDYPMQAQHIEEYPARTPQAAAIMLMIQNNLNPEVAQHPHELITYGGNGSVFQNWAQYHLAMGYLAEMTEEQTLVLYSGHPLGLFPSHRDAPRVVAVNGQVVPHYSGTDEYERLAALGVTMYGQMTAGSFMYIGPQGIVHGTTITLLNAGRKYLGLTGAEGLRGKVYLTSGLGGMSGAQAKAAVIAGAVGVVAEVNPDAMTKRHRQGWVQEVAEDIDTVAKLIDEHVRSKTPVSIGYLGNVVNLWEGLAGRNVEIHLGSDQTSLHIPYTGGYYPAGKTVGEANLMMVADPDGFRGCVQESLRRHADAVAAYTARGMYFWDYGNAFLLECSRAGTREVRNPDGNPVPSYVKDIMGPMCFDLGFGPFRWVCTSGWSADLQRTDEIAADVIREMLQGAHDRSRQQLLDNLRWIEQAQENEMVVGSQARILYADEPGRVKIAEAFNRAIRNGEISAPVVLGRDHHDVSGTDSPWRETANIADGSMHCADMAVHNVIGDSFRGATWVSLHNGGGVGWGEVINGGFGMLLDGTADADRRLKMMLAWDVTNGLARRAWARNGNAVHAIRQSMDRDPRLRVTLPSDADDHLVTNSLLSAKGESE